MSFVNTIDLIGDEALAAKIIERSITEIADNISKSLSQYAFRQCDALTDVDFRAVQTIPSMAFNGCKNLNKVNFSAVTSISSSALYSLPALTTAVFSSSPKIENSAFQNDPALTALILRNTTTICKLSNTGAFNFTPIQSGTGYIYVPRDLVDSYKAATNWSTFAAKFRALEDYTVDGTVTGELDPTKI